ncbi:MAG: universal stress protein [Halanaeroarchaeum sp.]
MYEHLLVPTDGSPESFVAIEEGADLAAALDAELTALYVVDTRDYSTLPESKWRTIVEDLEAEGERALEEATRRAQKRGVAIETRLDRGVPHESILQAGEEIGADLLVMSTHGRTGIDRFLLGSVTEKVIRSTTVPVLVIRAESD